MTVPETVTVAQNPGLVMVLKTVKISPMDAISPVRIMMVATVKVAVAVAVLKPVMLVNLIGQHMALNAVIQLGMSMVLIALH